jgi:hypothetical protein
MEGSWENWSRHVLKELERLAESQKDHVDGLVGIREEIATLKAKASIWGAIAGLIPSIILFLIDKFHK